VARDGRDLIEVVRDVLRAAGLGPTDRLVVGLSGGVDSQTLTHVLVQLRTSGDGPELHLAHVDHRLRPGSANDAHLVSQFAHEMSLPLDVIAVDVNAWRAMQGQGVEAAARAARYAALARTACARGTTWVAVGHNLDDQVETVLLRLARGTSPDGLTGMRAVSSRSVALEPSGDTHASINLVRPLLGVRRGEIEAYAAAHGLVPIIDESNADPRFRRNAMRHELIPALERIVPGASAAIARNADLLADDADLLNSLAVAAFETCCGRLGSTIRVKRDAFQIQPIALQRRILVLVVRAVSDGIELTRERVEALRAAALSGGVGSRIEIGHGVAALVDYAAVLVGPDDQLEHQLRRSNCLPELKPGAAIAIERSMFVSAGPNWAIEIETPGGATGWWLRTRSPGDRLLLPNGHQKRLQDWLVDRKVPVVVRDRLPLLIHDEVVRWVAGVSAGGFEDVHSRLTARLVKRTGDEQRDGEHAPGN
jgi:tRNA(Ile)-lysidine synthetase-like protein